jgi:hypothetical protein
MNHHALFVAVIAAACGILSLVAALYFGRSVLRHIYPELRARPNVLRHPVEAFWRRECLTPAGKEAHARWLVFASVGTASLLVAAWVSRQAGLFAALG